MAEKTEKTDDVEGSEPSQKKVTGTFTDSKLENEFDDLSVDESLAKAKETIIDKEDSEAEEQEAKAEETDEGSQELPPENTPYNKNKAIQKFIKKTVVKREEKLEADFDKRVQEKVDAMLTIRETETQKEITDKDLDKQIKLLEDEYDTVVSKPLRNLLSQNKKFAEKITILEKRELERQNQKELDTVTQQASEEEQTEIWRQELFSKYKDAIDVESDFTKKKYFDTINYVWNLNDRKISFLDSLKICQKHKIKINPDFDVIPDDDVLLNKKTGKKSSSNVKINKLIDNSKQRTATKPITTFDVNEKGIIIESYDEDEAFENAKRMALKRVRPEEAYT